MYLTDVLQLVVYGLVSGSILALGAFGVSLIFGILRFAHFAHGDLMTVGAFVALVVVTLGLPVYAALPVAMLGAALIAMAIDQVVYRRLRRTAPVILLISSFGIALALRSIVQLIWGPGNHVYERGIQLPYRVMGVGIRPDHITIIAGAVALMVALHLFLQRTKMGKAMRAMADNIDLAAISGVDSERVVLWTWAIGGALAAAAGVFLALDTQLNPNTGWNILLPVFAAAILGGIGKPYGAIAGGMVIGLAQELSTLAFEPVYKPAIAFGLMVAMLIVRPTGLLGGR
jgi:branched-chain amino acid transport system permease protein/neutral amino acid transport system permease protein